LKVYVPEHGGAAEAFYDVVSGGDVGCFTVDQQHNRSRWVGAGSFAAAAGPFSVRLTDRGDGQAAVSAAAVRLTCH
jgi:hypothetical protein